MGVDVLQPDARDSTACSLAAGEPARAAARPARRSRRGRRAAAAVAALIVVAGAFFWAGTRLGGGTSIPTRVHEPPPTVAIRRTVLKDTLTLAARVLPAPSTAVHPIAPTLGAGVAPLVTSAPLSLGEPVGDGSVLFAVAGSPTFAMQGVTPMYRPLTLAATGPDVAQLQVGLERVGYAIDDEPGYFGASTTAALVSFFRARGYIIPTQPRVIQTTAPVHGRRHSHVVQQPYLPASDVYFLPKLPGYVSRVEVHVGGRVGTTALRVASGPRRIIASGGPGQLGTLRAGMRARITAPGGNEPGTIAAVQADGAVIRVRHGRRQPPLGSRLSVRIVRASSHRPVWAVPASAITTAPDGSAHVVLLDGGRQRTLRVRIGISIDGYAAITPDGDRAFHLGERVLATG